MVETVSEKLAPTCRHDDLAEQALGNGLTFFKRELGKMLAQPLAKGLGIVHDVLPMEALLPRVGSLPAFLGHLVQRRSEFLPPCWPFRQGDHLGLIGIEYTLVLTLKPLPPLEQLRLVRFQSRAVVLFGFRPRLMQWWDHARLVEQWLECVPDQRLKPIRPHELGVALGRPAHAQRRVPLARIIKVCGLFAAAPLADAHQPQPARAACDERAQQIPA